MESDGHIEDGLDRRPLFHLLVPVVCSVMGYLVGISFPSVDHTILINLLSRYIACPPTMRLIEKIVASGQGIHTDRYEMQWFADDDLLAANRLRGLPIGNQTSQFWANVYGRLFGRKDNVSQETP